MLSRFRAAGLIWPTVLAVLGLAVLIGLGTWQLQRKAWKEALIRTIDARAAVAPLAHEQTVALKCSTADEGLEQSCEYRRVRLRGRFDNAGERHVFAGVQGTAGGGKLGYWVFTPFYPSAPDPLRPGKPATAKYVNRGFVPAEMKMPEQRGSGQLTGDVDIVAQIRTRQLRSWFDGADDASKNIYYVRDPRDFGVTYGKQVPNTFLLNADWLYLELVEGAPPGGFPLPMAGHVEIANRHLEYVLTWYGLALTLIGVYAAFVRSRLQGGAA